jgi:hypothetical protein
MRGIEFRISESFNYHVLKMLNDIDINNYNWHIAEYDFSSIKYNADSSLVPKDILVGQELQQLINMEEHYFIIHLNLRAFPTHCAITKPGTYAEYVNSDCFLVFLCVDGYFVEIYCKDEQLSEKLYEKCRKTPGISDVAYKTDENDGRYKLYVL